MEDHSPPLNPPPTWTEILEKVSRQQHLSEAPTLKPPTPEHEPNSYTTDRVSDGLHYAQTRLKERKVSPWSKSVLSIYANACEAFINLGDDAEISHRAQFATEIDLYERELRRRKWYVHPDITSAELQDHIVEVRKWALYTKYGDYLQMICHKLRAPALQEKFIRGWRESPSHRLWTEIAAQMKEEDPAWEDKSEAPIWKLHCTNFPATPATSAVAVACKILGLDLSSTCTAIHAYANRNKIVLQGLEELAKAGNFPGVAQTLHDDRLGLERLFFEEDCGRDVEILKGLLDKIRENWFRCLVPHDPKTWIPKLELQEYLTGASDEKKEREKEERANQVVNEIQQRHKLEETGS